MPDTRPRLFFWPLDEDGAPLGDPRRLAAFLNADPSRLDWFPEGSFVALKEREHA